MKCQINLWNQECVKEMRVIWDIYVDMYIHMYIECTVKYCCFCFYKYLFIDQWSFRFQDA